MGGSVPKAEFHGEIFFVVFEGRLGGVVPQKVAVMAAEEGVCDECGAEHDEEMARRILDPRLESEGEGGDDREDGEVLEDGESEVGLFARRFAGEWNGSDVEKEGISEQEAQSRSDKDLRCSRGNGEKRGW